MEPDEAMSKTGVNFHWAGYPVDMVLKLIKWFFIEQDINYWNVSGRNKFMGAVNEIFGHYNVF
jgi:hypothetical protein